MHFEVFGLLWLSARREIGGAGTDAPRCADARREEAAVGEFSNTHGNIDAILQKIEHVIALHEPQVDFRIRFEKFERHGQQVDTSEYDGRGDLQGTARDRIFAHCRALGLVDLLDNDPARLDVGLSRVGKGDLPGGAVQQPRLQMPLEFGNPAADRGEGSFQPA